MQNTYGMGREDLFTNFLDLQSVSESLGYQGTGLASLTHMVLGCANHKSKKVQDPAHSTVLICAQRQWSSARLTVLRPHSLV